jgi:type IV pilus assembly protein PilW
MGSPKMLTKPALPAPHGRSLLELLLAMTIALVVLGAILFSVNQTGQSSRQDNELAQLNEDATIAANLIRWQLRMAGYSQTRVITSSTETPSRNFVGSAVLGCEGGYTNNSAAAWRWDPTLNPPAAVISQGCVNPAADSAPDALTVLFEGDASNTVPAANNAPTDCLANGVVATVPSAIEVGAPYTLVENRFFIQNVAGVLTLSCIGNGGAAAFGAQATSQPLLPNVVDMQVTYGVAALFQPPADSGRSAYPLFEARQFLRADQVDNLIPGNRDASWQRVVSVNVCLLLRTPNDALPEPMDYQDCRGVRHPTAADANDRRGYRAVNITVALRNRATACANANTTFPDLCR